MLYLRNTIYFILVCILIHLFMYMFDIDIFEFFEKKGVVVHNNDVNEPNTSCDQDNIDDNIKELEKSLEELKDMTNY